MRSNDWVSCLRLIRLPISCQHVLYSSRWATPGCFQELPKASAAASDITSPLVVIPTAGALSHTQPTTTRTPRYPRYREGVAAWMVEKLLQVWACKDATALFSPAAEWRSTQSLPPSQCQPARRRGLTTEWISSINHKLSTSPIRAANNGVIVSEKKRLCFYLRKRK